MKVVFILPGPGASGGNRTITEVARRLLARGHQVRLLYRKVERDLRDWARGIQWKVFYRDTPNWIRQFQGPAEEFGDLTQCPFDPEEILVAVGLGECAVLDRLHGLPNPMVQYLHGSWDRPVLERALSLPYPKIVVASYLEEMIEDRGHGEEVVAVVHNGVDPSEYFCAMAEEGRDGVGTIYSSDEAKDPETILSVLEQLAGLRPGMPLRVFGGGRRARQIQASAYWRCPTLERAREIYSKSLVWIMASRSEGFGLPILEAMACGAVLVSTDCGGPRDMIQDGYNGFLVPVGDVAAIVRRVQLLLDDAELRKQMQQRGLETVKRFTWEKCARELERALLQVQQEHGREPAASSCRG